MTEQKTRKQIEDDKKRRKVGSIAMRLMSMGYGLDGDREKFRKEVSDEYDRQVKHGR